MAAPNVYFRAAVGLMLAGIVVSLPAIGVLGELLTRPSATPGPAVEELPRWVAILLFISWCHIAYAVYVLQLPHWRALQSVAILAAIAAGLFAMLVGWLSFGGPEEEIVAWLGLRGTAQKLSVPTSPAALWCLLVTAIEVSLAVWLGERATSVRVRGI
jgi:hypothetical protein